MITRRRYLSRRSAKPRSTKRADFDAQIRALRGDTPPTPREELHQLLDDLLASPIDLATPAHPKPHRLTAPAWLDVVRRMPCSVPGCPRPGRPFRAQLALDVPQVEVNHYPGRGRAGGGSDLEAHPVCHACHIRITSHLVDDATQEAAVATTLLQVVRAIREGWLPATVLLAAGAQVVLGEGP